MIHTITKFAKWDETVTDMAKILAFALKVHNNPNTISEILNMKSDALEIRLNFDSLVGHLVDYGCLHRLGPNEYAASKRRVCMALEFIEERKMATVYPSPDHQSIMLTADMPTASELAVDSETHRRMMKWIAESLIIHLASKQHPDGELPMHLDCIRCRLHRVLAKTGIAEWMPWPRRCEAGRRLPAQWYKTRWYRSAGNRSLPPSHRLR